MSNGAPNNHTTNAEAPAGDVAAEFAAFQAEQEALLPGTFWLFLWIRMRIRIQIQINHPNVHHDASNTTGPTARGAGDNGGRGRGAAGGMFFTILCAAQSF